MLPFNVNLFKLQYPSVVVDISDQQLIQYWYNNALTIGGKIIALFRDNTPINAETSNINSWDASTNIPTLSNATGESGQSYLCVAGGTVNFGAGNVIFQDYDIVRFNSGLSQWCNIGQPYTYFWACQVLAHVCVLANRGAVGRLSSASEGDVSGQFDFISTPNSAWWTQTPYGASCWQQMKKRGGFTPYLSNSWQGILYQGDNDVYQL
jgi:hypothetical protein